ncbi:hypothetical protein EV673_0672 [Limnobacter thiooxidans]|uniref:Conjugal transfer protein TrbC n=1 Tax=Limnobacter thiooxidans TaxID=131080 RepID=A0AA86MEQ3_9BURK|nr:hypothetical protein [Limnobacter sp.]MCZ8015254.1 hypothetical protein [Limnobacter sp.]RZS42338.1 hypothetical protein EV673_0672 [Limnobacter thiooxidans]BET26230.1 hypothetical protein RGQ30_17310 [Limnobacter thiooxidans]
MKLKNTLFSLFLSVFCVSTVLAHPGHHEHSDLADAFIHHVTSVYHSLMSLAVLGGVMLVVGLVASFTRSAPAGQLASLAQRLMGAALSMAGAGLLLGQL